MALDLNCTVYVANISVLNTMPSAQGKRAVYILTVIVMICTGTLNTLSAKYTNLQKAKGTNPKDEHNFDHPFFQTGLMFFGEMLCLFAFQAFHTIQKMTGRINENFSMGNVTPLVWILPALCDLIGTTMMFVALSWTFASSFQMLRGSVIIFTGVFSVIFLKAKLHLHHYLGIILVVSGLVSVGIGDYYYHDYNQAKSLRKKDVLCSDLLIVFSQVIVALQVVIEEKLLKKYRIHPLQAVGWEGLFGFAMVCSVYIPMYLIHWNPRLNEQHQRFENIADAIIMLGNNWRIRISALVFIISVGVFNVAGLSVTITMNATTRMVLDNMRTMMIWVVSLLIPWQRLQPLQPVGYVFIVFGTSVYHDLIFTSLLSCIKWCKRCFHIGIENERRLEYQPINPTAGGMSDEQASYENSAGDKGQEPQHDDMMFRYTRHSNI